MSTLDHSRPYIVKIPNLLTVEECTQLIRRIEDDHPTQATINTLDGPRVKSDVRNNDRVIFDDVDFANLVYSRASAKIPPMVHGMRAIGANERFRCYRYKPGMRFAPHIDFPFCRNDQEQSWYTFLIYLNEGFEGGNTTFVTQPEISIEPQTGMGLLFQHALIHEGTLVLKGVKYVARTDIMYRDDNSN